MVDFKGGWEGGKVGFATWSWKEEVKVSVKPPKRGFLLGPLFESQSNNLAEKWLWNLHRCM